MITNDILIAILKIKGVGPATAFKFIEENEYDLEKVNKNILSIAEKDENFDWNNYKKNAKEDIFNCEKESIEIISFLDEKYPQNLLNGKGKSKVTPILYYRGNISLIFKPCVAIIGTRDIHSDEPLFIKGEKLSDLLCEKFTIVSGLALGCDTIAHKQCVKNHRPTIAILPGSISSNIYPIENKQLADEIINDGGLLITENPFIKTPSKNHFIDRDRIQAELSQAIIVIKAKNNSGTKYALFAGFENQLPLYQIKGSEIHFNEIFLKDNEIPKKQIKSLSENSFISESIENIYSDICKKLNNCNVKIYSKKILEKAFFEE
jgi:DNA processing protein